MRLQPTSPRWLRRPEGANGGDFGPNDQLGRLNLLTPEKVRQGVAEVHDGLSFALSLPLDYPGGSALNPNRYPPVMRPLLRKGMINFNCLLGALEEGRTDVLSDDLAILHLQYSTQWDGLAHAGSMFDANGDGLPEALYYNGYAAGRDIVGPQDVRDAGVPAAPGAATSTSAAHALGIEGMARTGVQGRGVMIDLRAHLGGAHGGGLRHADARARGRLRGGGAGRHRLPAHWLCRGGAGHAQAPRSGRAGR